MKVKGGFIHVVVSSNPSSNVGAVVIMDVLDRLLALQVVMMSCPANNGSGAGDDIDDVDVDPEGSWPSSTGGW